MRPRLKLLIAVHIVIAVSPAAGVLIPPHVSFLPLLWALFSVALAQLMLLSFWASMGTGTVIRRLLGALLGVAYLATWPTVGQVLLQQSNGLSPAVVYDITFMYDLLIAVLFTGVFLGIRRWKAEVRYVPDADMAAPTARFQYSLLSLLVIITVAGVILGATRGMRATRGAGNVGPAVVSVILMFMTIGLVNLLCAVWASLSVGRVGLRILLVTIVAIMLGVAQSFALSHDRSGLWLVLGSALAMTVVPTAIVVVSLFVVRSCGYRWVSKTRSHRRSGTFKASLTESAHKRSRG